MRETDQLAKPDVERRMLAGLSKALRTPAKPKGPSKEKRVESHSK